MMTQEQITQKAEELSKEVGRKVYPLVFVHEEGEKKEQIIGYIQKPIRAVQMKAFDRAIISQSAAGQELLEHCLLKEHSHKCLYTEMDEYDAIFMGACIAALEKIKVAVDQTAIDKKK